MAPRPGPGSTGRLVGIDVARCLALLGMVATHLLLPRTPEGELAFAQSLAGGRASALFAVLAGLSIALMTGRRQPVRGRARVARSVGLVVRAGLVAFTGLVLAALDSGLAVILTYYGVLFLGALPVLGLRARSLLLLAATWVVVAPVVSHLVRPHLPERGWRSPGFEHLTEPGRLLSELLFTGYYPVLPWLAYLWVGMAVGRLDLTRRSVAAALAVGGAAVAVVATLVSDALTARADVVRALLSDPAVGSAPRTGPELLDHAAEGMYGTTPTGAWQWLLVRAPHSATPFDLAQTIGSALLVIGLALLVVGLLPSFGRVVVAVVFGAGTATLTLYSLHVAMRSRHLWPPEEPESFVWHVLVLGGLGAVLVALGRRGPLEAATSRLSGTVAGAVAGAVPDGVRRGPDVRA